MTTFRFLLPANLVLAVFLLPVARPVQAEETYHTCTGFIDSVPALISTQGVWCLRQNLGTSNTQGNAITIGANNVTIDCNNFKLGGLGAGNASWATGIYANNLQNIAIRHCNIRGFLYGINLIEGAGHLIEDNRLDNNLEIGIQVTGDNNLVRRNRVYDTGGKIGAIGVSGIRATADIVDNSVIGLFVEKEGVSLYGIRAYGRGTRVSGNTVSGFDMTTVQGIAYGLAVATQHSRVSDNHVSGGGQEAIPGKGISLYNSSRIYCLNNTVGGFMTNPDACDASAGNLTLP